MHILFAIAVIGALVIVRLGPVTASLYAVLGLLLQLLGGTFFAVGLLGDGLLTINDWIRGYVNNFSRQPNVSMAPLVIIISFLTLIFLHVHMNKAALEVVAFAATGACVILAITVLAQFVDVPAILARADAVWVRVVYVCIGFMLYLIGTRMLGT